MYTMRYPIEFPMQSLQTRFPCSTTNNNNNKTNTNDYRQKINKFEDPFMSINVEVAPQPSIAGKILFYNIMLRTI